MLRLTTMLCAAALGWQASGQSARAQDALPKHPLAALNAPTCQQIAAKAGGFAEEKTTRTTQYFTPLFPPGPDGGLRAADRDNCLKMEGSCIVGNFLYNAGGGPSGKRFERDKVKFAFGMGTGANAFNKTNALFPCRTLAADVTRYQIGTVIYIPSFKNKVCPQNSQPVDGCFIVGDVARPSRARAGSTYSPASAACTTARSTSAAMPRTPRSTCRQAAASASSRAMQRWRGPCAVKSTPSSRTGGSPDLQRCGVASMRGYEAAGVLMESKPCRCA